MTLRPAPKEWVGQDWTVYCSRCGRKAETKYLPGDLIQLCSPCYKQKLRESDQPDLAETVERQESTCRRRILN